MSFLSQGTFCGREVHFGMQKIDDGGATGETLLHTHYQGSNHGLVPSCVLAEYIPEALVRDFVHWYHHETGEIELRRSTPWTTDPNGWLLKYVHSTWSLTRGIRHIISPLGGTARHISAILISLDTVMHMHGSTIQYLRYRPVGRAITYKYVNYADLPMDHFTLRLGRFLAE